MPSPIPRPKSPPPEPPLGFWTSLTILVVGLALGAYLVWSLWYQSSDEPEADREPNDAEQPRDAPSRNDDGEAATEHGDDDVV